MYLYIVYDVYTRMKTKRFYMQESDDAFRPRELCVLFEFGFEAVPKSKITNLLALIYGHSRCVRSNKAQNNLPIHANS